MMKFPSIIYLSLLTLFYVFLIEISAKKFEKSVDSVSAVLWVSKVFRFRFFMCNPVKRSCLFHSNQSLSFGAFFRFDSSDSNSELQMLKLANNSISFSVWMFLEFFAHEKDVEFVDLRSWSWSAWSVSPIRLTKSTSLASLAEHI